MVITGHASIQEINTPSYNRKPGTCKACFCHRVTLTHTVKYANGNRIRICTRCANESA